MNFLFTLFVLSILIYSLFYQASRGIDKDLADQHSILRSWAIKDFAPNTPQFVQLFRPENKINIKFAGNERIYTIYKNLKEK